MGGVFCTCSACGLNGLCMFIIGGCHNMHISEMYICKTCWDRQNYCPQCAGYIIEWAARNEDVHGASTWYTSWVERSPK
jgi:hypothetical protein